MLNFPHHGAGHLFPVRVRVRGKRVGVRLAGWILLRIIMKVWREVWGINASAYLIHTTTGELNQTFAEVIAEGGGGEAGAVSMSMEQHLGWEYGCDDGVVEMLGPVEGGVAKMVGALRRVVSCGPVRPSSIRDGWDQSINQPTSSQPIKQLLHTYQSPQRPNHPARP